MIRDIILAACIIIYILILMFSYLLRYHSISSKNKSIFSKELIGHSRWAFKYEMKNVLKKEKVNSSNFKHAGIPIISDGKTIWVDDSEAHTLIVGTTGSGKTRWLINPLVKILAKKGESMIITDPKEELYGKTSAMLKENGYKVILLNFRNPDKSDTWNPLSIPYSFYKEGNIDKTTEFLEDLSTNMFHSSAFNRDPYLEETAAEYFCGLALYLFEDGNYDEINLNSIASMATLGEIKINNSTYMHEYIRVKGQNNPGYMYVSSTLQASENIRNNILSLFKQKIRIFTSRELLSETLSYSNFDIRSFGKEKTAVFIIIHDEKVTYHALASIFTKQCYELLVSDNSRLPIRLNFVLDEFGNMPAIKDFTNMITASRARNIRFFLAIQNFSQLDMIYKYEPAEAIKGNCSNLIYLLSGELKALEAISKLCGETKEKEPLITVSDLQRMPIGEVIIIKQRMYPFKTKLPDQSLYKFDYNDSISIYPNRIIKQVKTFNIISK